MTGSHHRSHCWGALRSLGELSQSRLVRFARLGLAFERVHGLAGASSAAAGTHRAAGARTAASGGTWGTAIEVPGTAALNQGGNAQIIPLSCASAGTCRAGGFYSDSSGRWQALVAGETNGTWHAAIEVPGTAALNQGGGGAQLISLSRGSSGPAHPARPSDPLGSAMSRMIGRGLVPLAAESVSATTRDDLRPPLARDLARLGLAPIGRMAGASAVIVAMRPHNDPGLVVVEGPCSRMPIRTYLRVFLTLEECFGRW